MTSINGTSEQLNGSTGADLTSVGIGGDLNEMKITATDLVISDCSIKLCDGNPADTMSSGTFSEYIDGVKKYAGVLRDKTTKRFHLVKDSTVEPSGTTDASLLTKADLDCANVILPTGSVGGHLSSTSNPHSVTASQVGLGNVDNVSEATILSNSVLTGTVTAGVIKAPTGLNLTTGNDDNTSFAQFADNGDLQLQCAGNIIHTGNVCQQNAYTTMLGNLVANVSTSLDIKLNDNKTSGLIVRDGLTNFLTVDTNTGGNKINLLKNVDITGNLTTSGLIDGIDIATDVGANTTHSGLTTGNPHSVTKADVGLGSVDNQSVATILGNSILTGSTTATSIQAAAAQDLKLRNDDDTASLLVKDDGTLAVVGNITTTGTVDGIDINTDVSANTTHSGLTTGNPHSVTATDVGLGNVTNESKATMFSGPTFTGTTTASSIQCALGGNMTIGNDDTTSYAQYGDNGDMSLIASSGTIKLQGSDIELKVGDNLASGLSIKEGSNVYMNVITTDLNEEVKFCKNVVMDANLSVGDAGGTVDIRPNAMSSDASGGYTSLITTGASNAWKAFNNVIDAGDFMSYNPAYHVTLGTYVRAPPNQTTYDGASVIDGDWLQISFDSGAVEMSSFHVYIPSGTPNTNQVNVAWEDVRLLKSPDGVTWTTAENFVGVDWTGTDNKVFNLATNHTSKYWRWVGTKVGQTGGTDRQYFQLTELEMFGPGATVMSVTGSGVDISSSLTADSIIFNGLTGTNTISMPDAVADALSIKEGANAYLTMNTSAETITLEKNTIITGDLTVNGTTTTLNTSTVSVDDAQILMADNNTGDATAIAIQGKFSSTSFSGLARHPAGDWKLFSGTTEVVAGTNVNNLTDANLSLHDCTASGQYNITTTGSPNGYHWTTDNMSIESGGLNVMNLRVAGATKISILAGGNTFNTAINVWDTLNATSSSSGSFTTAGGMSCQKDLWIGGSVVNVNAVAQDVKRSNYASISYATDLVTPSPILISPAPVPPTVATGLTGGASPLSLNMTIEGNSLVFDDAGTYECTFKVSAKPLDDNTTFRYALYVDGTIVPGSVCYQRKLNNRMETLSATVLIVATAGQSLDLKVDADTADDVEIHAWNMTAKRLLKNT